MQKYIALLHIAFQNEFCFHICIGSPRVMWMMVEETPQTAGFGFCVWWWMSRCCDEADVACNLFLSNRLLLIILTGNCKQMNWRNCKWKYAKMWDYEKVIHCCSAVGVIFHMGMLWKVWIWNKLMVLQANQDRAEEEHCVFLWLGEHL